MAWWSKQRPLPNCTLGKTSAIGTALCLCIWSHPPTLRSKAQELVASRLIEYIHKKNLLLKFQFEERQVSCGETLIPPSYKSTVFPCILDSALVTNNVLSQGEFPFTAVWMAAGVKRADLSVVSVLQCKAESRDKMHALCKCKDKLIASTAVCMTSFFKC